MTTEPATEWALPDQTGYELHCSTRKGPGKPKSIVATTITSVDAQQVATATGGVYWVVDGGLVNGAMTFTRDDPKNANWYFLLVGPTYPGLSEFVAGTADGPRSARTRSATA
ncbi:hypothetical protein ACWIGI_37475 [Nocardia sp. NPDC055321]